MQGSLSAGVLETLGSRLVPGELLWQHFAGLHTISMHVHVRTYARFARLLTEPK